MAPSPEEVAEEVLAEHQWDDLIVTCHCGVETSDMAQHQVDKLKDAGLMLGFSTQAEPPTEREGIAQTLGEESIQAILNQYSTPPTDPDCLQGKHKACGGTAWDTENDEPTLCSCSCHKKE